MTQIPLLTQAAAAGAYVSVNEAPLAIDPSHAADADCSTAVAALVARMPTGGHGHIRFPQAATPYKFSKQVFARTHKITVSGDGPSSELRSLAGDSVFEFGDGDGPTDYLRLEKLKFSSANGMAFDTGLVNAKYMRSVVVDQVEFDLDTFTATGTGLVADTSYLLAVRSCNFRMGRFGVGIELNSVSHSTEQQDTYSFDNTVIYSNLGVIVRETLGNYHGLRFAGTKLLNVDPDYGSYAETTTSGSSAAGASTLTVTSATGFAANTPIVVDYGLVVELAKVASVAGNVLTLSRPLRFAHASGRQVLKGGVCASLSASIYGATFDGVHFEGCYTGVLASGGSNITIGRGFYCGASELLRPYGDIRAVTVEQGAMGGNAVTGKNVVVNATGVTSTADCYVNGPLTTVSGAPAMTRVVGGADWSTSSTPTLKTKTANYTLTTSDAVVVANGTGLTITLPSAVTAGATGKAYTVKNINASAVTLGATAGTIDGATTKTINQFESYSVVSDGSNWQVV